MPIFSYCAIEPLYFFDGIMGNSDIISSVAPKERPRVSFSFISSTHCMPYLISKITIERFSQFASPNGDSPWLFADVGGVIHLKIS